MDMPRLQGVREWGSACRARVNAISASNGNLLLITIVPRAYMLTTARAIREMAMSLRARARHDIARLIEAVGIAGRPAPFIARLEFDIIPQHGDISPTKASLLKSLGIDLKLFKASRQGHAILIPHYHLVLDASNRDRSAIKAAIHDAWPGDRQVHAETFHCAKTVAQNLDKVGRYIFKVSFRHTTTYDGGATRDLEPYAVEWERWTRRLINEIGLDNLVFDRLGPSETLETQPTQRRVSLNEQEKKNIVSKSNTQPSRTPCGDNIALTHSNEFVEMMARLRHLSMK